VNSTTQTLPSGPVSFFADGGFAGESAVDRLKPGERRFLQFGGDLDVALAATSPGPVEVTKRLVLNQGTLEEHFLRTTISALSLENRSGRARNVYVALGIAQNAKVTGADEVDFDAKGDRPVVVYKMAARQKASRALETVEGLSRQTAISELTHEHLTHLAEDAALTAAERALFADAAAKRQGLDDFKKGLEKTKAEVAETTKDLERLREHLKALGDKGAANNPFVTRMLAAEDRLTKQRQKLEAGEAETKAREALIRTTVEKLKP
jgi:hypothetical protein